MKSLTAHFEYHAAKAFFASAWADAADESEDSPIGAGTEIFDVMPDTIESFGHYAAMQAMGHGVGLNDAFGDCAEFIAVPYVEFGSHSLEKDYF